MKNLIYIASFILLIKSCKEDKNMNEPVESLTIAEKIADANGFSNWKKISKIAFTFNVDRDSSHFERSWIWKPKTDDVILISETDTVAFNRSTLDSISRKANASFINDKFWLLIPFQLVWDSGTTISEPITTEAPISKTFLSKITLTYSSEGGYTPGDAYDIFYDSNFLIKEWVFRKENQKEPSMITTFENYKIINGIHVALDHKKKEDTWNLNFSNITITN
jgi:hypothetical protein